MACHCRRELTDTFSGGFLWQSSFGQGKWAAYNANFPTTINLQYEIGGAALSRPEAVHYCFILLVSYYQQSQSTPTAPHTQSRFLHYIYQALYKRRKHMTATLRAVFPPGLGGPLLEEGTFSWPTVHLFPGLGSSDTMRATYFLLHIPTTFP